MGTRIFLPALLVAAMMALALGVEAQQTQPDYFSAIDVFVTSYRGPKPAEPLDYHQSAEGKAFAAELQSDDDEHFCLQPTDINPAYGIWMGTIEPSVLLRTHGRRVDAEAYAIEHARKHDQDAVLVFVADEDGPDAEYIFQLPEHASPTQIMAALMRFKGGTVTKDLLVDVDQRAAQESDAPQVAANLGAKLQVRRGIMHLIMRDEYAQIFAAYLAAPHTCPSRR